MPIQDKQGRFTKNNGGGPGRPRTAEYLKVMTEEVTPEDWRQITAKAKWQAKRGNKDARKWLSDYVLGLPLQRSEITGSGTMLVEWIQVNQAGNDSSQPVQDTNT